MDAQDGGLRGPSATLAGHGRPLCHPSQSPLFSLFFCLPGSSCSVHRRPTPQLGPSTGVCFSSVGFDSPGHPQTPLVDQRPDDPDRSLLASTSVISGPSGSGGGSSSGPSAMSRSSQTAPLLLLLSRGPQAVASCVETIQRFARSAGFSSAVAAQVGLSRRRSSRTNQQLKWWVYSAWCR